MELDNTVADRGIEQVSFDLAFGHFYKDLEHRALSK